MKKQSLENHSLIRLLREFSPKELRKLSRFLSSEYFSIRLSVKTLFTELIKFHPGYSRRTFTEEVLYKKVYPNKKFNGDSFRDLLSSLLKAVLKFIVSEGTIDDPLVIRFVTRELRQRSSPGLGQKKIEQADAAFEHFHRIDSDFFLLKYRLEIEKFNYGSTFEKPTSKSVLKQTSQLKQANIYIIIYALLEILSNYLNLIIYSEKFGPASADNYIKDSMKNYSPEKIYSMVKTKSGYDFILEIYLAMINAFANRGQWEEYVKYRKLVKKYSGRLSKDEISFHYSRMISCSILGAKYCGGAVNDFDTELLSLYETFLEKGYYEDRKTSYIPADLYRAMIFHALKMNKPDWLYKIISGNEQNLYRHERENMQIFAYAFYYHSVNNSGAALKTIGRLKPGLFMFKYDIYNLKTRIYFENKDYDPALEVIHAYRQHLRNDTMMPAARKTFHRDFILYTEKLIKISLGSTKYDAGFLINKLKSSGTVVHKEWLIDKLGAFENAKGKYMRTG